MESSKLPAATLRYRFRYLGQRWRFLRRQYEREIVQLPRIGDHLEVVPQSILPDEAHLPLLDQCLEKTKSYPENGIPRVETNPEPGCKSSEDNLSTIEERAPVPLEPPLVSRQEIIKVDRMCLRVFYKNSPREGDRLLKSRRNVAPIQRGEMAKRPPHPMPSLAMSRDRLSRKLRYNIRFT